MLRVRENQADLFYIIHMNPTAAAGPIMRDAERLGMAGTMQFAGNEWTVGDGLIAMAPVAVEGYCSARNLPWFDDTGIPALDTLKKAVTKYEGEVLRQGTVLAGWAYGAILCEAARLAVAEVGVDNVDGPAMKRALGSMDLDVDGMVRFNFGPEGRRGETRAYIYQDRGGKWV